VRPYLKRAEHADAGLYQGDPDATAAMAVDERSHARVLTRLRTTDPSGIRKVERWHRGDRSGALRAAVFGVNDGLVSNGSRCASPSTTSVSVRVPSVWVAHRATDEHRFHSIESTAGQAHESRGKPGDAPASATRQLLRPLPLPLHSGDEKVIGRVSGFARLLALIPVFEEVQELPVQVGSPGAERRL
jgi:hypothetical protein